MTSMDTIQEHFNQMKEFIQEHLSYQTALVGASVGLLTYYLFSKTRYKYPPGPWALPLIGNYKLYTSTKMHRELAELSKKYGPVISFAFGPFKTIVLNNLEVVIEALVKRKADFAGRPTIKSFDIFSDGGKDIAMADYNATWKFQKKVAGKALRYYMQGTHLEDMINDVCENVFERMEKEKEPFVANEYIDKLVIHMLFNMCFGRKCNLDDPDVAMVMKFDLDLIEKFGNGFAEDLIPGLTKVYTSQRWKETIAIMDDFKGFMRKELEQHRATFDSSNIRDYTDSILLAREEAELEERKDEVGMLTDTHMIQILSDIFFAGLDTTRMTLDWFISFMVAHQECQEKCQKEIDEVVGHGNTPSATDRQNLCYTEACIMECMRLGTVVGMGVPHTTICDTTVGGYDVPKGTMVFINHWALHHDPSFWKDVNKFDPTRYLDASGKMDMKPENWLPFSAGRRVCLGEPVARTELLLIASNLLQNFKFKAPPGVVHNADVKVPALGTELPADYKVVIERRN